VPDGGVAPRRPGVRDGGRSGWDRWGQHGGGHDVELAETAWTPPVSWFTTCSTRLLGMANPTPMLPEDWPSALALAVVMPTTCPAALTRGPRSCRG
jgi:hypothetical protein